MQSYSSFWLTIHNGVGMTTHYGNAKNGPHSGALGVGVSSSLIPYSIVKMLRK